MSFEKAYEEFKNYAKNRHKKQGFITLTYDFNYHIFPHFVGRDISSLTKKDVVEWQNNILKYNYKNKYNARLYYAFNSFIKYCVCLGYLKENIVECVGPFQRKIECSHHTTYNVWQFRKFRFYLDDFILKQFFTFMFFYGTRPSETMGLRFLDFKRNKYICVVHSLQRKGKRELDTPKNQSSVRLFKIDVSMRLRICFLKRYYIKKYGCCNNDYFIFGGLTPLAPTTIDRYKKKAYIKAKLPSITQHEFRHSCATYRIHKKQPIDFVSTLLGHAKKSTTLDFYLHNEKNTLNVLSSNEF